MTTYTINAAGRTIGRVAAEAASALRGKNSPTYERHKLPLLKVHITNASKLSISERKQKQKVYRSYTGYPGGLKDQTLERMIERKGHGEVLKTAITRMLPRNRLRPKILKNLVITA